MPADAKEQPRMIYAGCDLGISTAKVVVTENRTILASEIVPYKSFPQKAATAAMEGALGKAGLSDDGIFPAWLLDTVVRPFPSLIRLLQIPPAFLGA